MALVTKVKVESVDQTGTVIILQETTGQYSSDNQTGYGPPSPATTAIEKIIFTISRYKSSIVNRLVFVRVFDPAKPKELTTPSIDEIALGEPVRLDSYLLDITTLEQGLVAFKDSVYDINEYSFVAAVTGVTGVKGNPYIIGTGLHDIFLNNYAILVGDEIYDIDKTKSDNGGEVIYLTRELVEDTTEFNPGYRANIKILITADTDYELRLLAAKLSEGECGGCYEIYLNKINEIMAFSESAKKLFDGEFYKAANDCIKAACIVAKTKCKCS